MPKLKVIISLAIVAAGLCGGCDESAKVSSGDQSIMSAGIEPKVKDILKSMSDTLNAADAFEFTALQVYDIPLTSGQIIQGHCRSQIRVRRPDKVSCISCDDRGYLNVWHNRSRFFVVKPKEGIYAESTCPTTNEQFIGYLANRYSLVMPVADLIFKDCYKILLTNVERGEYLGKVRLGKTLCHHLAFRQANIDWQIWIDAEEKPLPHKLVITYKNEPGTPRHVAMLKKWNLSPKFAENTFTPKIPDGARATEMEEMFTSPEKGGRQ